MIILSSLPWVVVASCGGAGGVVCCEFFWDLVSTLGSAGAGLALADEVKSSSAPWSIYGADMGSMT